MLLRECLNNSCEASLLHSMRLQIKVVGQPYTHKKPYTACMSNPYLGVVCLVLASQEPSACRKQLFCSFFITFGVYVSRHSGVILTAAS